MNAGSRSMLWYLLVGTRGGANRIRLIERLLRGPCNAHRLAEEMELDYRTVRHHLRLLEQAGAVARPVGALYAAPYEISGYFAAHPEFIAEFRNQLSSQARRWEQRRARSV